MTYTDLKKTCEAIPRAHKIGESTSQEGMSQGQVIDIMTFNPYSLQYYSFWKGKIGFARTVPVSWTTLIHTRRYS